MFGKISVGSEGRSSCVIVLLNRFEGQNEIEIEEDVSSSLCKGEHVCSFAGIIGVGNVVGESRVEMIPFLLTIHHPLREVGVRCSKSDDDHESVI